MARISLILPLAPGSRVTAAHVEPYRRHLEAGGHRVEVLGVFDPRVPGGDGASDASWRSLVADGPGLAASAVAGLNAARGELLAVLDLERGYAPEDLGRVIEALDRGDADLAVARRVRGRGPGGWIALRAGALVRPWTGTADLRSGLVALTHATAREAEGAFEPIGSMFALELLLRTNGRRVEVPVQGPSWTRPDGLTFDELRHVKRLADYRFGNASRLVQFCIVGASGMVVDLTSYALFQWVFSRTWLAGITTPLIGGPLDLALAGALAIAVALTWNFSLNRRLTFNYARRGSIVRQYVTYALSNALGIGLSFALRLLLPRHLAFFSRHKLAAAVVGIVAATGISFSMSRWVVFRRRSVARDQFRQEEPILAEPSPAP